MRRLALIALVVPLVAGCGWQNLLLAGSGTPVRVHRSCMVMGPDGMPRPCHRHGPGRPAYVNWILLEGLPLRAVPGAKLFATAGCTACHTYAGSGSQNLGAPDLTAIGRRQLGIAFEIRHLRCPSCVNPGSPMPNFDSLGVKRLHQLAIFLEASKGIR